MFIGSLIYFVLVRHKLPGNIHCLALAYGLSLTLFLTNKNIYRHTFSLILYEGRYFYGAMLKHC